MTAKAGAGEGTGVISGVCFIDSEPPLQVGDRDFALDLHLFNRSLNALVGFEWKLDEFQSALLGQRAFSLEAVDRDARKPHEGPSIEV